MAAQSKQAPPKQLTPLGYALAGALGGCFSNAYAAIVPKTSETDRHLFLASSTLSTREVLSIRASQPVLTHVVV